MKKLSTLFGVCICIGMSAQLVVTPVGPIANIGNFLTGSGVTITNVTYTGDTNAIGYFTANNTTLNMNGGFLMTTGVATEAIGPNVNTGMGTDNTYPGDADLNNLAQCNTFNAAVLEFDCVPSDDTLYFNFIFGSDEYMEYAMGGFNDVFAIFISGPSMPFQNIAWLPSSTIPVSVLNCNANVNAAYYVDRTGDPDIEYDGTTVNILATIPVVPGNTYHLKLAVADALDGIVDGGAFFEAGSFRTIGPASIQPVMNEVRPLEIFPSPTFGGNVNLQMTPTAGTQAQVNVYSYSGQIVLTQSVEVNANGTTQIDVSTLEAGLYTVEVLYDQQLQRGTLSIVNP